MKTWKQSTFIGILAILVLALALVACDNETKPEEKEKATGDHLTYTIRLVNDDAAKDETADCYTVFEGERVLKDGDNCDHVKGERTTHGIPVTNRDNINEFNYLFIESQAALDFFEEYGLDEYLAKVKNNIAEIRTIPGDSPEACEYAAQGNKYILKPNKLAGRDDIASALVNFVGTHPELVAILPSLIKIARDTGRGHLLGA